MRSLKLYEVDSQYVKYFAPLSFKSKHKKMSESIDFVKIKDYAAVININNMIPVPNEKFHLVDVIYATEAYFQASDFLLSLFA